MFSNEAGLGSVPNIAATADVSHPAKQGLVQTLGVYVDTLLICSVTAFIVLVYFDDPLATAEANVGAELTQLALVEAFGAAGAVMLAIIIFLLAFTSVLGNYSYGEANILFIDSSERLRKIYAVGITAVVFLGAVAAVDLVWAIAGVTMAIIATFNLVVILLLCKTAWRVLKDYDAQKKQGLNPVFLASDHPEIKNTECWTQEDVQPFLDEREGLASGRDKG